MHAGIEGASIDKARSSSGLAAEMAQALDRGTFGSHGGGACSLGGEAGESGSGSVGREAATIAAAAVPRIGQPCNANDDAALCRLMDALQAEADRLQHGSSGGTAFDTLRFGRHRHHHRHPRLEALEGLLESGEGADIELHPALDPNGGPLGLSPPIKLHSHIARLSSAAFRPRTKVQLPYSAPVVHALVNFLYTGRLVLPTALLADVYRAASEAGIRPLVYLLRTYPYYALRLTSAEKAGHVRRFAMVAGSRKIRALADDYLAKLAVHDRNYTLVAPVPMAWLRARPLLLGPQAIVLAFNHRPSPVHDESTNLVLQVNDVIRHRYEEDDPALNACLRLPTEDPAAWSATWFSPPSSGASRAIPIPSSPSSPSSAAALAAAGGLQGDADGNVWLYVLCPRAAAGTVAKTLLSELRKASLLAEELARGGGEPFIKVMSEDSAGGLSGASSSSSTWLPSASLATASALSSSCSTVASGLDQSRGKLGESLHSEASEDGGEAGKAAEDEEEEDGGAGGEDRLPDYLQEEEEEDSDGSDDSDDEDEEQLQQEQEQGDGEQDGAYRSRGSAASAAGSAWILVIEEHRCPSFSAAHAKRHHHHHHHHVHVPFGGGPRHYKIVARLRSRSKSRDRSGRGTRASEGVDFEGMLRLLDEHRRAAAIIGAEEKAFAADGSGVAGPVVLRATLRVSEPSAALLGYALGVADAISFHFKKAAVVLPHLPLDEVEELLLRVARRANNRAAVSFRDLEDEGDKEGAGGHQLLLPKHRPINNGSICRSNTAKCDDDPASLAPGTIGRCHSALPRLERIPLHHDSKTAARVVGVGVGNNNNKEEEEDEERMEGELKGKAGRHGKEGVDIPVVQRGSSSPSYAALAAPIPRAVGGGCSLGHEKALHRQWWGGGRPVRETKRILRIV